MSLLVVTGDIHANFPLAVRGLEAIEAERGPISQVYAVGDVGLFLAPEDWTFLTGPSKHKHPELSDGIVRAWRAFKWPFAMVGGNHEPYGRLRAWIPHDGYYGPNFSYTNAGRLPHSVEGMRVYGLSGIYHPKKSEVPLGRSGWSGLISAVRSSHVSPKLLTYYRREDVEVVKKLPGAPHLLLMHDWPIPPVKAGEQPAEGPRPERELVDRLRPRWVCSGHRHEASTYQVGTSTCITLNIICREPEQRIRPGWAALFNWDGQTLDWQGFWPPLKS